MIYLVIAIHVVVCVFMIAVILLQQGKSADLAGAFGGQGSQTAFGPRSAANLLTRITTWCAIIFMITSISLTVMMAKQFEAAALRALRNPNHPEQAGQEVASILFESQGQASAPAFLLFQVCCFDHDSIKVRLPAFGFLLCPF